MREVGIQYLREKEKNSTAKLPYNVSNQFPVLPQFNRTKIGMCVSDCEDDSI